MAGWPPCCCWSAAPPPGTARASRRRLDPARRPRSRPRRRRARRSRRSHACPTERGQPPLATSGASGGALDLGGAIAEAAGAQPAPGRGTQPLARRHAAIPCRRGRCRIRCSATPRWSSPSGPASVRSTGLPGDAEDPLSRQARRPPGAVATEQARVSRLEYDIALRDTVAEIKVGYAELLYLHQATRIIEQNQSIAPSARREGRRRCTEAARRQGRTPSPSSTPSRPSPSWRSSPTT